MNVECRIDTMSTQCDHAFKESGGAYCEEQGRSLLEVEPSLRVAEFVNLFEHEYQHQDRTFHTVREFKIPLTFSGAHYFIGITESGRVKTLLVGNCRSVATHDLKVYAASPSDLNVHVYGVDHTRFNLGQS